MIFTLIEQETVLAVVVNGIEYKQAKEPHENKVLYKPADDFIYSSMTVEELRVEVEMFEQSEAKRIAKHNARKEAEERAAARVRVRVPVRLLTPPMPTKADDTAVLALANLKKSRGSRTAAEVSIKINRTHEAVRLAITRLLYNGLAIRVANKRVSNSNRPSRAYVPSAVGLAFLKENFKELAA